MIKRTLFLLVFSCVVFQSNSQISFSDSTSILDNENNFSGNTIGVLDMNGDGLDDILRLDRSRIINVEYQGKEGQPFSNIEFGSSNPSNKEWSVVCGDLNEDGIMEVITGGAYFYNIHSINHLDTTMTSASLPRGKEIFVQGSNLVDIDNDGFLDLFACHDDGESFVYSNNQNGALVYEDDWLDMTINGSSGEPASGNYGSTWSDIDNDGDLDLYIAKCRQGVSSSTDPRRINTLYINDGNNNFSEQGEAHGLDIGRISWTADFGDINNDGWVDCLLTNHFDDSQILMNDGNGNFTELENSGIGDTDFAIQGLFRDFDNDGFLDVIVTGNSFFLFRNNGNSTFTQIDTILENSHPHSCAIGDLNNDGFIDIYAGYGIGFSDFTNRPDRLWMNNGNDNNYLTVDLDGVVSNREGIGARVSIYGDWGIQIRDVHAGESYGIINSPIQYFGLGDADQIDSLVVNWPSGHNQIMYDVPINTKLNIEEDICVLASPQILFEGSTTICEGDSLLLEAVVDEESILWSTGETTSSILVTTPGIYSFEIIDDMGCAGKSEVIEVAFHASLTPFISTDIPTNICEGETIQIDALGIPDTTSIVWSTGGTDQTIEVFESGSYSFIAEGSCDDYMSNEIDVIIYEILDAPLTQNDTVPPGETAILIANGNNITWYETENATSPITKGNELIIENLQETTSYFASDQNGTGIQTNIGQETPLGDVTGFRNFVNTAMRFETYQPLTIDSITVYTELQGMREFIITNSANEIIFEKNIFIAEGKNTISIDFEISVADTYLIATDEFTNFENFSTLNPQFYQSDEDVDYPYTISDYMSITGNNENQPNEYYSFYNWQISAGVACEGERSEVQAVLGETVNTVEQKLSNLTIFPNPSQGILNLTWEGKNDKTKITILDVTGKIIYSKTTTDNEVTLSLEEVANGLYHIQISNTTQSSIFKWIKY